MSWQRKRSALALLICFFILIPSHILASPYTSVLSFGDSLSDNGTYGQYPDAVNISSADIYGFQRYSNGPVWVEYLAGPTRLNVPLLDLAYGGATTGFDNPALGLAFTGLQWQVGIYQSTFASISPTTLVTVWAGFSDMLQSRPYTTAASNIGLAIQQLISIGGREFLVPNLSYVADVIDDPSDVFEKAWKMAFDSELSSVLASLRVMYPAVDIHAVDMNGFAPTGIDFFTGTWLDQTHGPGTYAWWDAVGVHPTTEIHAQIAAYATATAQAPEPGTLALLGLGLAGLGFSRRKQ